MFSNRRIPGGLFAALAVLLLLFTSAPSTTPSIVGASSGTMASCERVADFDPDNFSNSTQIDNEWSPLVPGTQLIFEGFADGLPHRVVSTVTDLTKVIDGVPTVVILDTDFSEGQVEETELAFEAQDDDGNVWNFGEYPEEYEDGEFLGAPSTWIAGLEGAEAGVLMRADPRTGTGYYSQGWAPEVDFFDCAKVFKTGESTCVPVDCFEDVLVTDEWSPLAPEEGHQRKFYAAGVGNIKVGAAGTQGETLELVRIVHLSGNDLAKVRREALTLERRAYRFSDVYRETSPAERR